MNEEHASDLACDFSAIPEAERDEHAEVARGIFESAEAVDELEQGYSFRLPDSNDMVVRVGRFIARERLCCPFFRFRVEVPPGGEAVHLELTGGSDVKTFLEDTLMEEWDLQCS